MLQEGFMNKINSMKNIHKSYCLLHANAGHDFKKYSGRLFRGDNCWGYLSQFECRFLKKLINNRVSFLFKNIYET